MTAFAIGASVIPPPDEPNKPLAVINVVGLSGLLLTVGALIYWSGKRSGRPL